MEPLGPHRQQSPVTRSRMGTVPNQSTRETSEPFAGISGNKALSSVAPARNDNMKRHYCCQTATVRDSLGAAGGGQRAEVGGQSQGPAWSVPGPECWGACSNTEWLVRSPGQGPWGPRCRTDLCALGFVTAASEDAPRERTACQPFSPGWGSMEKVPSARPSCGRGSACRQRLTPPNSRWDGPPCQAPDTEAEPPSYDAGTVPSNSGDTNAGIWPHSVLHHLPEKPQTISIPQARDDGRGSKPAQRCALPPEAQPPGA